MRWLAILVAMTCAFPAAASELPSVKARFALRRGDSVEHLELTRAGNRVAHVFVERGIRELWERNARGELEHVRAYPSQGKSVHYTPGDLRTIHLWPAWDTLTQLISEQELAQLKPNKKGILEGTLRGQPARVEWLESDALPKRITIGKLSIELLAVEPASSVQPDALESIEFADLGDKEYDPFVRRFLAKQHHDHPQHPLQH